MVTGRIQPADRELNMPVVQGTMIWTLVSGTRFERRPSEEITRKNDQNSR